VEVVADRALAYQGGIAVRRLVSTIVLVGAWNGMESGFGKALSHRKAGCWMGRSLRLAFVECIDELVG